MKCTLLLSFLSSWGCSAEGPSTVPIQNIHAGHLVLDKSTLDFGYTASELILTIKNDGEGLLTWAIQPSSPWVSASPSSGTLAPGMRADVSVAPSRVSLVAGMHTASIEVISNGGNQSVPAQVGVLSAPPQSEAAEVNVRDFGALGDGQHDDTAAFSAALSTLGLAGGTLYIPAGIYVLRPASGRPDRALDLSGRYNITIRGDGAEKSILRMAANHYSGDTHLVFLERSRYIAIRELTLDGNRQLASFSDEQNHCVEIWSSVEVRFSKVQFQYCRGDGIRFVGAPSPGEPWTEAGLVEECVFLDNGRSGIAVQRAVRNLQIRNNTFERISDQSIDIEPTGGRAPTDVLIEGNTIRHSTSTWAVAIGGVGDNPSKRFTFKNNTIHNGGILVYKTDTLLIRDNILLGDLLHPAMRVLQTVTNATITSNTIVGKAGGGEGVVQVVALNGLYPSNIVITHNNITAVGGNSGIYIRDITGGLTILGNQLIGNGGVNGVHAANIVQYITPRIGFVIENNVISGFQNGVVLSGRDDKFDQVYIKGNSIDSDRSFGSELTGILFLGTGPYEGFADVVANEFGMAITREIEVR